MCEYGVVGVREQEKDPRLLKLAERSKQYNHLLQEGREARDILSDFRVEVGEAREASVLLIPLLSSSMVSGVGAELDPTRNVLIGKLHRVVS
ncbi:hypothetical protein MUK42_05900 [Musa troglodytarum]|uniref:Uncharacterized protein n=1 Tax=Musa troglodytarum TaxID=320322 RepID=A0A9E7GDQ7_9LILI|nr:hypothetical protein MUK42_05900 [Musa troglodytarum]